MTKNIDWIFWNENEKKKKDVEKINENENNEIVEFQKKQEKIREKIKVKESLEKLKDLINAWILTKKRAQEILGWENINSNELLNIFEKIDQLEKIDKNKKILPKDFKITKQEYIEAISDFEKKSTLLKKIDNVLDYMYSNMWWGWLTFSLFSFLSYNLLISKKTQKIQENLIDIKNNVINNNI